ncbi:MAG TPA: 50S ribosomal protein L6 [Patescibacteria group bacterium]|jgi:large subunit ribosomal protein L6|nr:50S ribosomal protein L6 [Patescibacteria group bacterium]
MSRIGKLPIDIPSGVTITVDSAVITVKGPKGELTVPHLSDVTVSEQDGKMIVVRKDDEKIAKSQHGLQRALLQNAVTGVTAAFEKKLEVNGVGYRISGGGSEIELSIGLSHPVKYKAPEGITLTLNKMEITVSGIDKQAVGQAAAEIRAIKKPEPYKGKGIKYADEQILRKAGKAGK